MPIVIPATFRFGIPDPMPTPPPGWAAVARTNDWFLYMNDDSGKFYMPEFLDNGDVRLTRYREATPQEQVGFAKPPTYIVDRSEQITLAQGWKPPGCGCRTHLN
jgi:hypothetical protein